MDDERIRQLTEEVLGAVRGAPDERARDASIEARLGALEAAVRRIEAAVGARAAGGQGVVAAAVVLPSPALARGLVHPGLRILDEVPCGEDRCVLEPDKPCEKSGRCRTFGY
jgi:hypothetical protein